MTKYIPLVKSQYLSIRESVYYIKVFHCHNRQHMTKQFSCFELFIAYDCQCTYRVYRIVYNYDVCVVL